jgi:hypothetical protein
MIKLNWDEQLVETNLDVALEHQEAGDEDAAPDAEDSGLI